LRCSLRRVDHCRSHFEGCWLASSSESSPFSFFPQCRCLPPLSIHCDRGPIELLACLFPCILPKAFPAGRLSFWRSWRFPPLARFFFFRSFCAAPQSLGAQPFIPLPSFRHTWCFFPVPSPCSPHTKPSATFVFLVPICSPIFFLSCGLSPHHSTFNVSRPPSLAGPAFQAFLRFLVFLFLVMTPMRHLFLPSRKDFSRSASIFSR